MSNTLSPTTKNRLSFRAGDAVWALFEPAYIVDVLYSEDTDRAAICVSFPRNFGNARDFDIIAIDSLNTHGVEQWEPIDKQILFDALQKRVNTLQSELNKFKETVGYK